MLCFVFKGEMFNVHVRYVFVFNTLSHNGIRRLFFLSYFSLPNNPANLLFQWIGDFSNTRQMIENYRKCYQKYSRNETLNAFKKREAMVPWDMLR